MSEQGHGWVFRQPGGHKKFCGGPGTCDVCNAELRRLAADYAPRTAGQPFESALEAELQATFNRARAAT
jgi:hypothetical protein